MITLVKSINNKGFEISLFFFVALIPFSKLFWLPVFFMFIHGFFDFLKRPGLGRINNKEKAYFASFLLFWIPALVSVPGAYDVGRAIKFCVVYLVFFISGYYVLNRVSAERLKNILNPLTMVVFVWVFAATLQVISSGLIFGESSGGRYQGIFGDNMIMGYTLIPLIGLLVYGWAEKSKKLACSLFLMMLWGVLISGNRAAWVSFAVLVAILIAIYFFRGGSLNSIKLKFSVPFVLVALSLCIYIVEYTDTGSRLKHTVSFINDPSFESVNSSSAGRMEIWNTAFLMARDNIWTGVGARSFRYAYPEYTSGSDFVTPAFEGSDFELQGPMYVHQIVLQVFVDTGISGLIGILLFYFLVYLWVFNKVNNHSLMAVGFFASYLAMIFPFNTHLNLYGNFFGVYFWLLTAIFISLLFDDNRSRSL
jgi:O-antigen ligase